jgi:hypothetical protein
MQNHYPLGNSPPLYYNPPSPAELSSDEDDDRVDYSTRYLPRLDMIFAAKNFPSAAERLARREQRRKGAFVREKDEETRMKSESARTSVREGGKKVEKGGAVGKATGKGERKELRDTRSVESTKHTILNPEFLRPRQPFTIRRRERTPAQQALDPLARRINETVALDERQERELAAMDERLARSPPGQREGGSQQPLRPYEEELARKEAALEERKNRRTAARDERMARSMQPSVEEVADEGDQYVEKKTAGETGQVTYQTLNPELFRSVFERKRKAGMQPTVEDTSDDGNPYVEATQTVPRRQPAHPTLDADSSRRRRSPSLVSPRTTIPEDVDSPLLDPEDPESFRRRQSPSPVRMRNAARQEDLGPPIDRRSLWYDYFMSLDQECEERAKEALRRAGVSETTEARGTRRAGRSHADTEQRRTGTENRRTDAEHTPMDTDSHDWFAYFEDAYDSDTMEYQHRLEEARRYGIPISPPAVASGMKKMHKKSEPRYPVAKRQKRDAPEGTPYPCYSTDNVLKNLSSVSQRFGRWSAEAEMRRRGGDEGFVDTVVETTFTHKPETVESTPASEPATVETAPASEPATVETAPAFEPATVENIPTPTPPTVQTTPTYKPVIVQTTFTPTPPTAQANRRPSLAKNRRNSGAQTQKKKKKPKKVTFKSPIVESSPTFIRSPLTARNLSRFDTAQELSRPSLVKSRRRPSFDSLYNVSTGSSRSSDRKGTMRRPGMSAELARDFSLDEVDVEEQEAIMADLQETRRSAPVAVSTGNQALEEAIAKRQAGIRDYHREKWEKEARR